MEEYEFLVRVREAGGFDIEHLMDTKPSSCVIGCREFDNNDDYNAHIVLFARMGIHKYNMIQGTNLQLSCVEKYNYRSPRVYSAFYITLIAKDPDACNSLVTFQTRVVEEGFNMTKHSCNIARPNPGPQENAALPRHPVDLEPVDVFYKGSLPEWPPEDAFNDNKRFYVVKKSELLTHDWIRLYMELAFLKAHLRSPKNPNLSKLVIVMVAIETKDNMEPPSERLKARNAFFYIKYKYHANKGRGPKRRLGHKTHDRIAIVRRTLDKNTGYLTLEFPEPIL
ncbi:putative protein MS5 [Arabidopsis thaliana]|nr:Protein MS5 [Arabidopsis thaliana x Arabidopsis arenosa]